MSVTCSHVMIRVASLPAAVADYRAAGFEVRYASPERRAQHAHVWFTSGPILELVTAPRFARLYQLPATVAFGRPGAARMMRWTAADEGFCDLALATGTDEEFAAALARLRADGVRFGRPVSWRRTPPGGTTVRFRFAYPADPRLPFLVSPYHPAQQPTEAAHANGATGIAAVTVGVRAADQAAFDLITASDPALRVEPAEVTAVRAVHVAGLTAPPDAARLHGAVLRPA